MKRTTTTTPPARPRRTAASPDAKALVRAALAEVERGEFGLTPEAVLKAAKDPASPLHALFEWDAARAAHAHWLVQAREIIVAYRVTTVTNTTTYEVPYYARNPKAPADRAGYVSVDELRSDADLAHEHLLAEFARVRSALERARGYAVTLGRAGEVDLLIESVVGLRAQFDDRAAA